MCHKILSLNYVDLHDKFLPLILREAIFFLFLQKYGFKGLKKRMEAENDKIFIVSE